MLFSSKCVWGISAPVLIFFHQFVIYRVSDFLFPVPPKTLDNSLLKTEINRIFVLGII